MLIPRPGADEHAPHYSTYVNAVAGDDVLGVLAAARRSTSEFLAGIAPARAGHRYAPGKWTFREVIGHLSDAERIFGYRLLRIARADATPLAGFDEDAYVPAARFESRTLADVSAEFAAVRDGTLMLVRGLDAAALAFRGVASNHPISARALVWIIAGHEQHHLRVLRERYLPGMSA